MNEWTAWTADVGIYPARAMRRGRTPATYLTPILPKVGHAVQREKSPTGREVGVARLDHPAGQDRATPDQGRVMAFGAQRDGWRGVGVPVFVLPGVTPKPGACLSCGEPLAEGRRWRCALCVVSIQAVIAG